MSMFGLVAGNFQLAVIDHNHHLDREVEIASDGTTVPVNQFSRKTKQWVSYERKVKKNYNYIPGN